MVRRGYESATSAEQLRKAKLKDPPWLKWLAENMNGPYVLVTYDNNMPVEHAGVLRECGTTLAIVDKQHRAASGLTEEQYWREVIHRNAHRLAEQPQGTIFKYHCSSRRTEVALALQDS